MKYAQPMVNGMNLYDYFKSKNGEILMNEYEGLVSVKYMHMAVDWTQPYFLESRGLIIDTEGRIIARPYSKFFNYLQLRNLPFVDESLKHMSEWDDNVPFSLLEKLDGSLAIFYNYNGLKIASSGSTYAESTDSVIHLFYLLYSQLYSQKQKDRFAEITEKYTLCMEYLSPKAQIVVKYDKEDFVLHGAIETATGKELSYNQLEKISQYLGCTLVKSYPATDKESALKQLALLNKDSKELIEGFVVRFDNGKRLKIKTEEYFNIHGDATEFESGKLTRNKIDSIAQLIAQDRLDDFYALYESKPFGHNAIESFNKVLDGYQALEKQQKTMLTYLKESVENPQHFNNVTKKNYTRDEQKLSTAYMRVHKEYKVTLKNFQHLVSKVFNDLEYYKTYVANNKNNPDLNGEPEYLGIKFMLYFENEQFVFSNELNIYDFFKQSKIANYLAFSSVLQDTLRVSGTKFEEPNTLTKRDLEGKTVVDILIGISGSGKSTYTELQKLKNPETIIVSSDEFRKRTYGEEYTDVPNFFEEYYAEFFSIIEKQESRRYILDATNLKMLRRADIYDRLKKINPDIVVQAIVFFTDFNTIIDRQSIRRQTNEINTVETSRVVEMFRAIQPPKIGKDCDNILGMGDRFFQNIRLENMLKATDIYQVTSPNLLREMTLEIPHDTPKKYHSESVDEHITLCIENARKTGNKDLIEVALFHDLGKPLCKFKVGDYANFKGHENVSAYYYLNYMLMNNHKEDRNFDILYAIENHMIPHRPSGLTGKMIFNKQLSENTVMLLDEFNKIDNMSSISTEEYVPKETKLRVQDVPKIVMKDLHRNEKSIEQYQRMLAKNDNELSQFYKKFKETNTDFNTKEYPILYFGKKTKGRGTLDYVFMTPISAYYFSDKTSTLTKLYDLYRGDSIQESLTILSQQKVNNFAMFLAQKMYKRTPPTPIYNKKQQKKRLD